MVEVSKHMFEKTCSDVGCDVLLHPWHRSCVLSSWTTYKESFIGSAKFYSLVYMVQIALRGKKMLRKEEWAKMGEYYVRSTVLGGMISGSNATLGCLLRWILGNKFRYYTYVLLPGTLNGLFIYLEPPSRRGLVINLFTNLLLEYWLRSLDRAGVISVTKSKQTLMFMVGSALLFYLMRLEGERKQRTPLLWLFTPEKVNHKTNNDNGENVCPHKGPCLKYIARGYLQFFGTGLALSLARVVLPKISSPMKALSSIRGKHFRMALFFSSYIGIYRSVLCYLCRKRGHDSASYALPAGYLAGLSFLFSPNLGFAIASLTAAFKLYSTTLYERNILPSNVPLPEMLYCFCQGSLFHARFMHPEVCPNYIFKVMSSVSNNCSESLYSNMLETIKRAL